MYVIFVFDSYTGYFEAKFQALKFLTKTILSVSLSSYNILPFKQRKWVGLLDVKSYFKRDSL